ncbi:transmembrane protein 161B [Tribolium madens]|uniref:transmembrane protein 161B n=1 Tax=Tribolium madens TaxID=41895 RepID=UPI001CF73B4D|nr:transmembrane protein 161B [Tribolium madens]XP_044262119.1 transmembrane protein 161B [Tribolium madens]XP_044262120.1 transmembrane protein 161B [Tribolium madens]XP_044262121.1 transmembrane protein 161B [Tribolium madens]XP_044262122.1 transmembrane protein 161B [Tribolium madens]
MALLGAQLVITLVMISVIQKLGPHFSFARWLLCSTGLVRYLYPTDAELRHLASIPRGKKGPKQSNGKAETFHVPRSLDVSLETAKVTRLDVIHLRYYSEYQWLLDFTVYAVIVYVVTEVYQTWFPLKDEVNLSMMWCGLVLLFSIKLLLSLTVQYFKGEESVGERSTCIVMGFTYLLISMMVLIVDENTLELGLEDAYNSFNKSASVFLSKQGLNSSGPASKIVLKFFIALWCGILGALFTFPGLRIAKMHWDLLKYFRERKLIQIMLNVSFALPFVLVIFWIKPVARTYITVRIFSGMTQPLLTTHAFETLRIVAIVLTVFVKLVLMPWYLQAYLDMAYNRTQEQKKEAGRITNIEFQKKIAAVFYYLCVVTLQYITPIIMCLILSFMYKTLGEFSWGALFKEPVNECPVVNPPKTIDPFETSSRDSIAQSAAEFHATFENLKSVFSAEVFRGIFGFSTWWCCFVYFATTSVGLVYQTYFSTI